METIENMDRNIPGILLMTHGQLCNGLIDSATMIGADVETNVFALPFLETTDLTDYVQQAVEYLRVMPDGSIVLLDLFSGTPFNQLLQVCFAENLEIHALCGVNLPILLEACVMRESMAGEELIDALREAGINSLVNAGEYLRELRVQAVHP